MTLAQSLPPTDRFLHFFLFSYFRLLSTRVSVCVLRLRLSGVRRAGHAVPSWDTRTHWCTVQLKQIEIAVVVRSSVFVGVTEPYCVTSRVDQYLHVCGNVCARAPSDALLTEVHARLSSVSTVQYGHIATAVGYNRDNHRNAPQCRRFSDYHVTIRAIKAPKAGPGLTVVARAQNVAIRWCFEVRCFTGYPTLVVENSVTCWLV